MLDAYNVASVAMDTDATLQRTDLRNYIFFHAKEIFCHTKRSSVTVSSRKCLQTAFCVIEISCFYILGFTLLKCLQCTYVDSLSPLGTSNFLYFQLQCFIRLAYLLHITFKAAQWGNGFQINKILEF